MGNATEYHFTGQTLLANYGLKVAHVTLLVRTRTKPAGYA